MSQRLQAIKERCERATPQTKRTEVERQCFDDGSIAYEIQDDHHLVAFYERNHKTPMKAKFNAELYAHAREDIPYLLDVIERAKSVIDGHIAYMEADHEWAECRNDEDCDHCLGVQLIDEAREFLKELGD